MATISTHFVYGESAISFVTVAAQTCLQLEHVGELSRKQTLRQLLGLLPILYSRALLMERPERELDGETERFVTEEDYDVVIRSLQAMLGDDDSYLDVLMEDGRYSDEPWVRYISEDLADVYQVIKDLAANYQSGNESVMNDALADCLDAFEEHWGQKVLNAMRAMHAIYRMDDDAAQDE